MLTAGDLLGDRYRLVARIAGGGMGDVWQATDEVLGRTVAVKVLHNRAIAQPGFGDRFRHEARTMAALHHPGVVDVYDYGEVDESAGAPMAYLVMAHVDGQPLSEKIWTKRMSDSGSYSQVVAAAASDGKRAPAAQQTAAAQDSVNTRQATPLSIPVPIHPCLQSIRTPASCGKPT